MEKMNESSTFQEEKKNGKSSASREEKLIRQRLKDEAERMKMEIADELGVSRQGIHDNIIRAEAHLQKMEAKTGCVRRYLQSREAVQTILTSVKKLENHADLQVRETAIAIANAAKSIEE